MARSPLADWMVHLPLVLLGIRTSVRQDSSWCPAELVYGATLRLPGEFLAPPSGLDVAPSTEYVTDLQRALAAMRPAPSAHHLGTASRTAVPSSLDSTSHVYVRIDAVKRPLTRPYEGPFRVVSRSDKTFVLSRAGRSVTVSVDRLKPALGYSPSVPPLSAASPLPAGPAIPATLPAASSSAADVGDAPGADAVTPAATCLRSGCLSRPPRRFIQDF